MARRDRYGDKGPKKDRRLLSAGQGDGYRRRVGSVVAINRADDSRVLYRETVAGPRRIEDDVADTQDRHTESEAKIRWPEPDDLCGYCYCARSEHTGTDISTDVVLSETCCTHPDHDCLNFEFEGVTTTMVKAATTALEAVDELACAHMLPDDWYKIVAAVLQVQRDDTKVERSCVPVTHQFVDEVPENLPPGAYAMTIVDFEWKDGRPIVKVKLNLDDKQHDLDTT